MINKVLANRLARAVDERPSLHFRLHCRKTHAHQHPIDGDAMQRTRMRNDRGACINGHSMFPLPICTRQTPHKLIERRKSCRLMITQTLDEGQICTAEKRERGSQGMGASAIHSIVLIKDVLSVACRNAHAMSTAERKYIIAALGWSVDYDTTMGRQHAELSSLVRSFRSRSFYMPALPVGRRRPCHARNVSVG